MRKLFLATFVLCGSLMLHAQQDSLHQYVGKYKFPDGSIVTEITVSLDNGVLTASSVMGNAELKHLEGEIFEIVGFGGTATFKKNAEAKVTGVQILVGDINIEGTKTEGWSLFRQKILAGH